MSLRNYVIAGSMLMPLALWLSGCGKSATTESQSSPVGAAAVESGAAPAESGDQDADVASALASLPAPDRQQAVQQAICPVSDQKLGTMGTPLKIEAEGQSVFLCCEGCKDKFLDDTATYLAKLKK